MLQTGCRKTPHNLQQPCSLTIAKIINLFLFRFKKKWTEFPVGHVNTWVLNSKHQVKLVGVCLYSWIIISAKYSYNSTAASDLKTVEFQSNCKESACLQSVRVRNELQILRHGEKWKIHCCRPSQYCKISSNE